MKTSRRHFLGSVAVVPVVATAPAIMASPANASLLMELIDRYEHFRNLSKLASDKVDELYQSPGRPDEPSVRLGEVDIGERGMLGNRSLFRWADDIDAYYATAAEKLEWLHSGHGCNRAHYVSGKEQIPAAATAAKSLLANRKAACTAWEAQFGISAALEESDRLCEIEGDLHNQICAWPISTLEEARLVARYLLQSHGEDDLDGDVEQFLKNIIGETA